MFIWHYKACFDPLIYILDQNSREDGSSKQLNINLHNKISVFSHIDFWFNPIQRITNQFSKPQIWSDSAADGWRQSLLEVAAASLRSLGLFLAKFTRPASMTASALASGLWQGQKCSVFAVFMAMMARIWSGPYFFVWDWIKNPTGTKVLYYDRLLHRQLWATILKFCLYLFWSNIYNQISRKKF